jgi:hypothetical protein
MPHFGTTHILMMMMMMMPKKAAMMLFTLPQTQMDTVSNVSHVLCLFSISRQPVVLVCLRWTVSIEVTLELRSFCWTLLCSSLHSCSMFVPETGLHSWEFFWDSSVSWDWNSPWPLCSHPPHFFICNKRLCSKWHYAIDVKVKKKKN